MASTNRTEHLLLSQWVGSDKPKMADINADNQKIDAAVSGHTGNGQLHLAAGERAGWNAAVPVIGSYVGDGDGERKIALGFQPSFGMLFAIDQNIVQAVGSTGNMKVYSAFVSSGGCSQGAFIEPDGFSVLSVLQVSFGRIALLNESGVSYCYIMFR